MSFALKDVYLRRHGKQWVVQDSKTSQSLHVPLTQTQALNLLAITGNQPFQLIAEWQDQALLPLTLWVGTAIFPLSS